MLGKTRSSIALLEELVIKSAVGNYKHFTPDGVHAKRDSLGSALITRSLPLPVLTPYPQGGWA